MNEGLNWQVAEEIALIVLFITESAITVFFARLEVAKKFPFVARIDSILTEGEVGKNFLFRNYFRYIRTKFGNVYF